ncbi:MAG TPA: hypothetical protein VMX74_14660, partial [Pirellulales bacterium]|nr:hypothetical protein [Pirellulales bacterium]
IRAFKLLAHSVSIVITALVASVFLWADVHIWLAGFVGAFSAMLFMYLLYMLLAVLAARVKVRSFNLGRFAFGVFVAGTLLSSLVVTLADASLISGGAKNVLSAWPWGMAKVMQSPIGAMILLPFDLFTQVMLTANYPDLFRLMFPCFAINALMFWAVLEAERFILARNLIDEQQRYAQKLLTSSTVAIETSAVEKARTQRVPQLPWLSGAGPVAWRQLTAVRHSLGGVAMCAGLFTLVIACATFLRIDDAPGNTVMVWFGTLTITQLLLPGLLPFDFRRDVQEITLLKTLPISPRAVVMGQLLIPVAIATLCQALVVMLAALVYPQQASVSLIGLAYFVPANLLIFGLENLAFLLYPYRLTSFDMQTTARRALMLFAKMLVLVIALALALTIAVIVMLLSSLLKQWGISPATVQVCAGGVLLMGWWMALALTWQGLFNALCWAYRRFDPCIDRVV